MRRIKTKFINGYIVLINIIFLVFPLLATGQNYNNIWYFGDHAGLDFNSGAPVALTNSVMNTFEGSASIADDNGDLMFYTDGSTIWNKVHAVMTNGSGLLGDFSSTQSAIIIPEPLSANICYVFTVDAFADVNGLRYSIVDMALSAGLGAVTQKNIPLLTPITEKICAVRHTNGVDIWIIVHQWANANFNSYLLTPAGLNLTPVVTTVGSMHTSPFMPYNNAIGYMKASPNGTKIALGICDDRIYELFQFNATTGVLSNPITFPNPDGVGNTSRAYGLEFSPNSKYLYLKNFYSCNIYQYDITIYNQSNILSSQILIGTLVGSPNYYSGAMQLGPDGKIYIVKYGGTSLASISSPNNQGLTCNFIDNAVSLSGNYGELGLPTLLSNAFIQNTILYSGCYLGPLNFWLQDTSLIVAYHWCFGDNLTLADTSSQLQPFYTYSQPGNYTVTVQVTYVSGTNIYFTSDITLLSPPDLIAEDSIALCLNDSIGLLVNGSYVSYLWSTGETTAGIYISDSGLYTVTVIDMDGCLITDQVYVGQSIPGNLIGSDSLEICPADTLHLIGSSDFISYLWNTGEISPEIIVADSGLYVLTVTDVNGCQYTDQVYVSNNIPPVLILPLDTTICLGDSLFIKPAITGIYDSLRWENGYDYLNRLITLEGQYSLMVFYKCGIVSDSLIIKTTDCNSHIKFPNCFTPNHDSYNEYFLPESENVTDFVMHIFDRWGILLYETNDILVGWDGTYKNKDCSDGVYYYIAEYTLLKNRISIRERNTGVITLLR